MNSHGLPTDAQEAVSAAPRAMILSGAGRYGDPWHPFDHTTPIIARLAEDNGWEVAVSEDIDQTLAFGLDGIDLIIVNAGDPSRGDEDTPEVADRALIEAGRDGLAGALARGMAVLGVHAAASSLRDYPQFRCALGGEWVPGRSWHPAKGDIHVRAFHDQIAEGLCDFTVHDERYTDLVVDEAVEPLLYTHADDEKTNVLLAWAHLYQGSRVVYVALGHDTRSYESCGHKSFLRRVLSWLSPQRYDEG